MNPNGFDTFQFHTGSIRRCSRRNRLDTNPMFQFHTGSIRRLKRALFPSPYKTVSIPHWFD